MRQAAAEVAFFLLSQFGDFARVLFRAARRRTKEGVEMFVQAVNIEEEARGAM